jgi:hypothetical protein
MEGAWYDTRAIQKTQRIGTKSDSFLIVGFFISLFASFIETGFF